MKATFSSPIGLRHCQQPSVNLFAARVVPLVPRQQPLSLRTSTSCPAASSDPYELLGVKPDADNMEIARAINRKKYEARGNDAMRQKIEQAEGQLMLKSLNRRLKDVPKDIAYADREPLFPWRPRRWDATPNVMLIVAAVQLALAASAFQAPNMSKLIFSMLIGVAGNVMKQNAIAPPPKEPEYATPEEEGRAGRNFMRGALLGLLATFTGMILCTAPESILQLLKVPLPGILATQPGLLISFKVAGVAFLNFIITAFYY